MYREALSSSAAQQYPNWCARVVKYWERHELWCLAWRTPAHRGHNTNNYSEVTVRIFKDIVLSRVKAYNPVALVDFICTTMQHYYVKRLLLFAHSRVSTPLLDFMKMELKTAYCQPNDIICLSTTEFEVRSEEAANFYSVNMSYGVCSCPDGALGKFCKHQAAVTKYYKGLFLYRIS